MVMYIGLALTTVLSAYGAQSDAPPGIRIGAKLTRARYCTEATGAMSVHLYLSLAYTNPTSDPILVPMFARVSSYRSFRDLDHYEKGQAEDHVRFRMPSKVELPDLTPRPADDLFSFLAVGGRLEQQEVVTILLGAGRHRIPLGTDRVIDIDINHWPRSPDIGLRLREEWRSRGNLLISRIRISNPIKIHIEKNPVPSPCGMQVD